MERRIVLVLVGVLACGESGVECPPDYPVERDGFCYREDGGAAPDAGGTDTGATGEDGGSTDDAATDDGGSTEDAAAVDDAGSSDGGGVICRGTHPLLDGERRYCEAGDCFCASPDNCYPEEVAAECCEVDVVCEDADAGPPADGGGVICRGTHPIVEDGRRFCEPGDCFCASPDNCYPSEIAASCCEVTVECAE